MRFFVVVVLLLPLTAAKTIKKTKTDSAILNKKLLGKAKPLPPAIIAIEIVDPNENKTSKYSKRTTGGSLGYGYHQSPPKYQVYKYSQRDIPPFRARSQHYEIQKSVSYRLPTQILNRYYQPGTTVYSTINSQGQVGGVSSHAPLQDEPQVPVIVLRVYPSQLADPSAVLHPNLPQSHPLAAAVNAIDVQSLLAKYVQSLLVEQQPYHPQYQPQSQRYQPQSQQYYQPQYQQHHQPQYQQAEYQQPEYQYQQPHGQPDDGLLTHENYPKETHTRVIFRTDKAAGRRRPETKTIQIALPAHAYSAVQVETPHMQYSYTNQEDGGGAQSYQQDGAQSYYYQPDSDYQAAGYQQAEQYEQPEQHISNETPHNYHAHQKRSKDWLSRVQGDGGEDVIKLAPIRA